MLPQHGDGLRRQGDIAAACSRLWLFHPQACLRLFDATLDPKHAAVEVSVRPLQAAQLAAPAPGKQRQGSDGVEAATLDGGEHGRDLIRV
jgi:hypothetical protein